MVPDDLWWICNDIRLICKSLPTVPNRLSLYSSWGMHTDRH